MVSEYAAAGHWVSPPVLDPEFLSSALKHAHAVFAGEYDLGRPPKHDWLRDGEQSLRKIDGSARCDSMMLALATAPAIGELAAQLLDADEVYLWHDQLIGKPGGGGDTGNVGWHQDVTYWQELEPCRATTAWVPLVEVDEEIGTLRFVTGSHRFGQVEGGDALGSDLAATKAELSSHGYEWDEAVALPALGGMSFHDAYTVHGSGPNSTDRMRVSMSIHLIAGDVTWSDRPSPYTDAAVRGAPGTPVRGPHYPRVWPPPH